MRALKQGERRSVILVAALALIGLCVVVGVAISAPAPPPSSPAPTNSMALQGQVCSLLGLHYSPSRINQVLRGQGYASPDLSPLVANC